MKKYFSYLIVAAAVLSVSLNSCDEEKPVDAAVETGGATDVTNTQATLWGTITEQGTVGVTEYGIEINSKLVPHTTTKDGSFGALLTDLVQGTQYRYRAYVIQKNRKIIYGEEKEFTTLTPTGFQLNVANITHQSVEISFTNTDLLSVWGFHYRAGNEQATIADTKVEANGNQTVKLEGLLPNTLYQILGYATGKNGLVAPATRNSFLTTFDLPQVTDPEISAITTTGATVSFEISYIGGGTINRSGIRFSTNQTNWTERQVSYVEGEMTHVLTGLTPATKYYVQSYARNSRNRETFS